MPGQIRCVHLSIYEVVFSNKSIVLSVVHSSFIYAFVSVCVCVCVPVYLAKDQWAKEKKSSKQQDRELVSDFVDFSVAVPSN